MLDDPRFRRAMDRLLAASRRIEEGKRRGGISGLMLRASGAAGAAFNFARMYLLRPRANELPSTVRLQPAW